MVGSMALDFKLALYPIIFKNILVGRLFVGNAHMLHVCAMEIRFEKRLVSMKYFRSRKMFGINLIQTRVFVDDRCSHSTSQLPF